MMHLLTNFLPQVMCPSPDIEYAFHAQGAENLTDRSTFMVDGTRSRRPELRSAHHGMCGDRSSAGGCFHLAPSRANCDIFSDPVTQSCASSTVSMNNLCKLCRCISKEESRLRLSHFMVTVTHAYARMPPMRSMRLSFRIPWCFVSRLSGPSRSFTLLLGRWYEASSGFYALCRWSVNPSFKLLSHFVQLLTNTCPLR